MVWTGSKEDTHLAPTYEKLKAICTLDQGGKELEVGGRNIIHTREQVTRVSDHYKLNND